MEGNLVHPCMWSLLSSRETNIGGARKWSSASQLAPLYSSTTLVELSNPRCRCRRKGQKLPSSRHLPPVVCSGVAESLLSGETMAGVGRSCRFGRKQRKEASRLHTMGDHPLIPDPADACCKVLQGFSKWEETLSCHEMRVRFWKKSFDVAFSKFKSENRSCLWRYYIWF